MLTLLSLVVVVAAAASPAATASNATDAPTLTPTTPVVTDNKGHHTPPSSMKTLSPTMAPTPSSTMPLAISAGNQFTCMVLYDKSVSCTGSNEYGNLGFGGTSNAATPMRVAQGEFRAKHVSCGMTHTCAVSVDGDAWCWGSTSSGESGNDPNDFDGYTSDPVQVTASTGLGKVSTLCAGMYFTVAIQAGTGQLWGWGSNLYGVLGAQPGPLPYGGYSYEPGQIPGFDASTRIAEVTCGQTHVCYLTTEGALGCHGFSNFGQIPTGGIGMSLAPVWVSGFSALSVSAGAWHTCTVDSNGGVWCSGSSSSFQAGGPTRTIHSTLTRVPGFAPTTPAVTVVAGQAFNHVLFSTNEVYVFGSTANGQAATGVAGTAIAIPVEYARGAPAVLVAAGVTHSAFVDPTGQVWAAGLNIQGQLGTGEFGNQYANAQRSELADPAGPNLAGPPTNSPTPKPKTAAPTRKKKKAVKGRRRASLRGASA